MNRTELVNSNSTISKNIHEFLQNGDKKITYSHNKDIVLLVGNTGSGKSTLTLYVTGNGDKLLSREVGEGTGQYVIVDENNKISGKSTVVSQTIYPDLVEDAKTNTLYYDCPGFSDTRSAAHEIAATYFIKNVIDSARAVKMVFVVNHKSVSHGEDRKDFLLMLQHATDFIKQMGKFKNSIALVVTKIENRYVRGNLVSDERVIKSVGTYLEQVKKDVDEHPELVSSAGSNSNTKQKVLSLLDIFLSKGENGQYTRIGIFRKPDEAGRISDIELMKQGKASLENLINKNIQFVEVGNTDFGYTVSARSEVYISYLAEEINKTIVEELNDIGKEIQEYCVAKEEKTSDLDDFISLFQDIKDSFSKIQDKAIKDIITHEILINDNIKNFNISIPDYHIKTIKREEDYINFLNLVSNNSIKSHKSSLLAAGLSNLIDYLNDSHSFYSVLNSMYKKLSEFDIQKNRGMYNIKNVKEYDDLIHSPIFKEIENILKEHSRIKEMKLNSAKLDLLNRVLDQTLKYQIEINYPEVDKIVVKGLNVVLSDISEHFNNKDIKFIEIYALHKVFIDTSLDLTGREIQMAIIAPVWEVVGSPSILLDGKAGTDYYPEKAKNGETGGGNGYDGQPGRPGGPAGNFIGIGKHYIKEEYLYISAKGGNGGRGQDGGDGAEGYDGAHCTKCRPESIVLISVFYNKGDAEYPGQDGGNGGNGGSGGYGGHKGFIYIINVGRESKHVRAKQSSHDGIPGGNGKGGRGGPGGRYYNYKVRNYVLLFHQEGFETINKWATNGKPGEDGANQSERINTWKLSKLININNIKIKYRDYLQRIRQNDLQSKSLATFLTEVDDYVRIISQVIGNRKRRNIKKSEELLRNTNMDKYGPKEMKWQSYDQYVSEGKKKYYLDLYRQLYGIGNPVSRHFSIESENTKQIPFKPTFPMLPQLENIRTQKYRNLNEQYSSMDLHGNILLSEMVLKKFVGNETSSSNVYGYSSEEDGSSAHDLAYRHYLGRK